MVMVGVGDGGGGSQMTMVGVGVAFLTGVAVLGRGVAGEGGGGSQIIRVGVGGGGSQMTNEQHSEQARVLLDARAVARIASCASRESLVQAPMLHLRVGLL
jgi:hypothetical protein